MKNRHRVSQVVGKLYLPHGRRAQDIKAGVRQIAAEAAGVVGKEVAARLQSNSKAAD